MCAITFLLFSLYTVAQSQSLVESMEPGTILSTIIFYVVVLYLYFSVFIIFVIQTANPSLKARLHLQSLLRFLVRFSRFSGCERVNQTRNLQVLIHSLTSIKRRKSPWESQPKLQNGP